MKSPHDAIRQKADEAYAAAKQRQADTGVFRMTDAVLGLEALLAGKAKRAEQHEMMTKKETADAHP